MNPIVDLHTHNNISMCCTEEAATAAAFVEKAAAEGIQVLGISNHCWDSCMPGAFWGYPPQNVEWCLKIREQLPEDTGDVKVFIGIESEYKGMTDELGISAEGALQFDYVLIPHTHMHMVNYVIPYNPAYQRAKGVMEARLRAAFPEVSERQIEKWMMMAREPDVKLFQDDFSVDHQFCADFMCDSFVALLNNAEVQKFKDKVPTFVAHPFCACGYSIEDCRKMLSLIPDEKFKEMFTLMAEKGIGYDLSVWNFMTEDPENCRMFRVARIARDCGVKFLFGTDTHDIAGLRGAHRSTELFHKLPLTKEDLHPFYREYVK